MKLSRYGKGVHFTGKHRTVTDGPFIERKELVAGLWLGQVCLIEEPSSGSSAIPTRYLPIPTSKLSTAAFHVRRYVRDGVGPVTVSFNRWVSS